MLQVYSTKSANDRIPVLREDEVYLRSHIRNRGELLTAREIEVLHWIARGKSDWEIGEILQISAKTVNFHVENSKRKFGVPTRIQAVVLAICRRAVDD